MTKYIIPLNAISRQTFSVALGSQNCQITIDQRGTWGVFVAIAVDAVDIVSSSLARDRVGLVRYAYTGFVGEVFFADTLGTSDPDYTGFGTQYLLVYDDAVKLK